MRPLDMAVFHEENVDAPTRHDCVSRGEGGTVGASFAIPQAHCMLDPTDNFCKTHQKTHKRKKEKKGKRKRQNDKKE
jgi:hypothetical protein